MTFDRFDKLQAEVVYIQPRKHMNECLPLIKKELDMIIDVAQSMIRGCWNVVYRICQVAIQFTYRSIPFSSLLSGKVAWVKY